MDAVNAVAARRGISVVEDCAQSTGADYRGRRAGSMSHALGVLVLSDENSGSLRRRRDGAYRRRGAGEPTAAAACLRHRKARTTPKSTATTHGSTSSMQKSCGASSSASNATSSAASRSPAATTNNSGDSGLVLPVTRPGNRHVFHLYVVRHPARDAIIAGAGRAGRVGGHSLSVAHPHDACLCAVRWRRRIAAGDGTGRARDLFAADVSVAERRGAGSGVRGAPRQSSIRDPQSVFMTMWPNIRWTSSHSCMSNEGTHTLCFAIRFRVPPS